MRTVRFEIPEAYPLLNHSIGQSRFALTNMRRKASRAVALATVGSRLAEPFAKAHVTIERHSSGTPDKDGLVGGAKFLIDSLATPRALNVRKPGARQRVRNKRGLGFIVDDGPAYATFDIRAVKCRPREGKTVVTIAEILP